MLVRAIVVQKNRRLVAKNIRDPRASSFKLGSKKNEDEEIYFLDSDASVWARRRDPKQLWLGWEDVQLYYFAHNHTKPIPLHDFAMAQPEGLSAAEFGQLFNEKFYQIIARAGQNKREEMIFYLSLIAAGASGYAAWRLFGLGKLIEAMAQAMGILV